MDFIFDGSFSGLMTVVFDTFRYKNRVNNVESEFEQTSLFNDAKYIPTDKNKADRVIKYIRNDISPQFFASIQQVFLSSSYNKYTVIVKIVHMASSKDPRVSPNNRDVKLFNRYLNSVRAEAKRVFGTVKFRKMNESIYFAVIKPKMDILSLIVAQFKAKLEVQRFAVFDAVNSKVAYFEGDRITTFNIEMDENTFESEKDEYLYLWDTFFKAISVTEREKYGLAPVVNPVVRENKPIELDRFREGEVALLKRGAV